MRDGKIVGAIENTPGSVFLNKTKHDIVVSCEKPSYGEAKEYAESGIENATFGNIILGGLIGWGIDSAVGADNNYPENISVTLVPQSNEPEKLASSSATNPNFENRGDLNKQKLFNLNKLRDEKLITEAEYQKNELSY
jgi:hypothetical protein